jgi:hypothetical protein
MGGHLLVFMTVVDRLLVFKTTTCLTLQGLSMASGGRAFLASHKSSPAVDG